MFQFQQALPYWMLVVIAQNSPSNPFEYKFPSTSIVLI